MRVVLVTGKGGVGKTTTAAATWVAAAAAGRKTLLLSTDPVHSLADALGVPLGADPVEVDTGLCAAHVDTGRRLATAWPSVSAYAVDVLERAGVDPAAAEELTALPGAAEVLALLEVRDAVASGRWDVVVVDTAATAETLRLLALPEAVRTCVDRALPPERRMARALRPVLSRVSGVPAPPDRVVEAVDRLVRELAEVRAVLTDPAGASVRLVLTPEAVGVAAARRTRTALALHGYRVDAVVANRVIPTGDDPWRAGWAAAQAGVLADARAAFAPLPVLVSPYRATEPVGLVALAAVAASTYDGHDPLAPPPPEELVLVERDGEGFVLTVALPLVDRAALGLARDGDDLVVTAAGERRVLPLPSALRRCAVTGARLVDGRLRVGFAPDPELWMRDAL